MIKMEGLVRVALISINFFIIFSRGVVPEIKHLTKSL